MRAVILLGGPNKGTRFRPLSLDLPKPLFPVAGRPIIQHQIEQCIGAGIKDVFLLGSYPPGEFNALIEELNANNNDVQIKYLFEYEPMSTAGGIFHYRDTLQKGIDDDALLVLNADVCNLFDLEKLLSMHRRGGKTATMLAVKSEVESSKSYGCLVIENDQEYGWVRNKRLIGSKFWNLRNVEHFVEKPATFVSATISCGIYVFNLSHLIIELKAIFAESDGPALSMECDVLPRLTCQGEVYGCVSSAPFAQIKSASSAVSVSAIYLGSESVFVAATAKVHPSAKIGPNVSIGPHAIVKQGARIRNAIILDRAVIGGEYRSQELIDCIFKKNTPSCLTPSSAGSRHWARGAGSRASRPKLIQTRPTHGSNQIGSLMTRVDSCLSALCWAAGYKSPTSTSSETVSWCRPRKLATRARIRLSCNILHPTILLFDSLL